ncbi:thiamine diphosphokinase [Jeotgalibacillus sp. ET6]|uniref:thiamine diphosphokinase n=1 Tax=Jeotgalibacillus sp. ET6 TaxID=3037260 RepID=UPI0024181CDA|nr:thiamine diphosphokinase [Jeotgalibacillus sp. ET6]MDG5470245.1 thiamine diphosphokinase [Jeotgalibacillus sp. ET6]
MIYLVGGGPIDHQWLVSLKQEEARWIGVDRGTDKLIKAGASVERAFGDFDSVSKEEYERIVSFVPTIETAEPEKNETDLEMALKWALQQSQPIRLIGVTGGRLDHFMGNLQLLVSHPVLKHSHPVEILDEQNRIAVYEKGEYEIRNDTAYRYLSFIPITQEVEKLTLTRVKYPLTDHNVKMGTTLTISNEFIAPSASISFQSGILMMIRSKDNT